jgi:hypothetical protein
MIFPNSDPRQSLDAVKTMALPPGELFAIDEFSCMLQAKCLTGYRPTPSKEATEHIEVGRHLAFRMAVASICHQFNWDYLNAILRENLLVARIANIPEFLVGVSARDFTSWFKDSPDRERMRAAERAEILRDVGDLMDKFEVFRVDPIRKKTNVLTHDIVRLGIAPFRDLGNIEPAIDYHLIRIYLRSGRVFSKYRFLFDHLSTGDPVPRERTVKLLRETVAEAVKLTAHFSGLTIPDVNYIEWQLGRNVCVRDMPKCKSEIRSQTLDPAILKLFEGSCPYIGSCAAFKDAELMKLQEPVFNKNFY